MTAGPDLSSRYFQLIARAEGLTASAGGIELLLDGGERLRVDVLRADVLRLKISRQGRFDEQPTCAVQGSLGDPAPFTVEDTESEVRVVTDRMSLVVTRTPFRLDAYRADGSVLFETALDPETGAPQTYATLNDEWMVTRRCQPADSFYGLGETTGRLNRHGRDFTLWNSDVLSPKLEAETRAEYQENDPRGDPRGTAFSPYYISIPFFYRQAAGESAAAGFFFDNSRRVRVNFSDPTRYQFHFAGGQYTEYIFAGPAVSDILTAYTALTGRMAPPPLWTLGHHQCRWKAYPQEAVEALGQEYRRRKIPCDAIWLDIDYMDGFRVFTWNATRFPDPAAMLARLQEEGLRAVTIVDPGVKIDPGYAIYDEALAADLLCRTPEGAIYTGQVWPGRTAFPDFSLPEAREWWGRLNTVHVASGLAGIWNDMNEPATGDIPPDAMTFQRGQAPHERYHNEYAALMAMGTVEGLLAAMPDRRTFVLSRAGSPGIQRYAANWLGDNCSRWEHLWMSMPMAMGLGLSGQPFVGADVGGFMEDTHPELLARWYQYGALTPFFRNHSCMGQIDQYPWSFGPEVEAVCRAAIERRYCLLPYIYSAFIAATETGAPVQRPLVFDHQDDPIARDLDDQYLLGRDLLVAPIYRAGETARDVYLPAGVWYDAAGAAFPGGRWHPVAAPLDTLPHFFRGGSVVPQWPAAPATTMGYQAASVDLHVYLPAEDGETVSVLHEDDGVTFARNRGGFYRTEFRLRRAGNAVSLDATVSGDGFPEFARTTFRLIVHGPAVREAAVDGRAVPGDLVVPNAGQFFGVTLRLVDE